VALVEQGRLAEAEKLFPRNSAEDEGPFHVLAFSVAWHAAGNEEKAAQWFAGAVELMRSGTPETAVCAGLLTGREPPPLEEILDLGQAPSKMAIILVALAQRFPDRSKKYFAAARKINRVLTYPHYLLRRIAGE
jgi:hypothetical protein